MTPRAKTNWFRGSVTVSAGALIAAIAWSSPRVVLALNDTYVRRDSFDLYRRDLAGEIKEIHRLLAVADSSRRCDKGRKEFCP